MRVSVAGSNKAAACGTTNMMRFTILAAIVAINGTKAFLLSKRPSYFIPKQSPTVAMTSEINWSVRPSTAEDADSVQRRTYTSRRDRYNLKQT